MDPVHTYKRIGYQVTVYPNRVVILEKPSIFPGKETIILVKQITSLDVEPLTKMATLKTNDGKSHQVKVFGKDAQALRDALMALL